MICLNCGKEFPIKVKIDGKVRNLCTRKYCLDCSPFGSLNRRRLHDPSSTKRRTNFTEYNRNLYSKTCSICDKVYHTKKRYCGACNAKILRIKQQIKAVEYLGGSCKYCGYNEDIFSFHFHHKNPEEKLFGIGNALGRKKWKTIKEELKKCILLCANCHQKHHSQRVDSIWYDIAVQELLDSSK